jgi:general secretion pathway protein D
VGGGMSSAGPSSTGDGGATTMSLLSDIGGGASSLENVRVVSDDDNNSLMIYATGKQYELIQTALEQLDVVATQVIIEASILEVSLTDELRYGLEWSFKNGIGNDHDGKGLLATAAGGPASIIPGFSYTVTNSIGDISAVLNALAEESLINVISTPSVMVLDNHTAYIHVGDQVPTFDQQTESDGGRITQSVTYKDTGVKLTVTPSVNAGGLVTMDVEQSVTDVGPIDEATGQRAFLERNIMSRVAVRSNQSVVLGGLIRENASNVESGIPILYKLPLIGPAFGSTTKEDRRTELLVIITPRAIYNESELRQVSDEMRSQIRHMELIELPEK